MMQSWGPKPFGHRKRTRPPTATTYKAIKVPNCWVSPPSPRAPKCLPGSRGARDWGAAKPRGTGYEEARGDGQNAHDFEALRDVSHPLLKTGAVTGNIR